MAIEFKNSNLRRIVFVVIVLFIMVLTSCEKSDGPQNDRPLFAFVINQPARFWDLAHAGCQQAAREVDAVLEFHIPGQSSAAQQRQIVESLIARRCNGLAISPLNPESLGRLIDQAAQYMPVICQDSDAPNSKRIAYIGTDNIEAGRIAGQELLKALPEGGQVAIFVGQLDVANARERYQGVRKALENSKCTIVEVFTDQTDRSRAQANVRAALAKYPDLKGIIGLWNYNAPAAVMALRDYPSHKISIVGFDEDVETLRAIRNGKIISSIAQNPYEFGYQSICLLYRIYSGQPADIPENGLIYIPVTIITKDNVDMFESDINEKLRTLTTTLRYF